MKTILIIEDNVTLRDNTTEFLTEEGYKVIAAEDGLEGVQLTMKNLPDLILCDIAMPNMDGYDFYKTIQQVKATSTIPLIFLTAKSSKEDLRRGMQLGADDYITKPFDYDDLLEAIRTRLSKYDNIIRLHDEKFYTLIDNTSFGVYIYQNNKFVYFNEVFSNIFGYTPEEFKYLCFDDLVADMYIEEIIPKINHCFLNPKTSLHLEFNAIRKNRENIGVELTGNIILYKGIPSMIGNVSPIENPNQSSTIKELQKTNNMDHLSKREIDVLKLICKGYSTQDIAKAFVVSKRTIDSHRANILCKTGCKNTAELIMHALKNSIVILE